MLRMGVRIGIRAGVGRRNAGESFAQQFIRNDRSSNLRISQQVTQFAFTRPKYTDSSKYKGGKVAGQRHKAIDNSAKQQKEPIDPSEEPPEESNEQSELINDREYDSVAASAMHVTKRAQGVQHVAIIQPFVKWGPRKSATKPDLMLQEAEALVRSLPRWNIELSLKVPVETLDKRQLFGSGKLEELKEVLRAHQEAGTPLTCVFVSKGTLSYGQKQTLEHEFRLPVMDRYSMVVQILRLHAVSMEAKLQVALAELPYIWSQVKDQEGTAKGSGRIFLSDAQRQMLQLRERKLRHELAAIRSHRELLRNRRRQKNFPVVAIVGYTNAGKTSLIKALTEEQSLQPRDQLFATLDVTAHAGLLPCKLEVLYMDTVGFMADIPTGLIECFVATLEDAMLADVIVHVQDMAHENCTEQRAHVERTLATLMRNASGDRGSLSPERLINVGNKVDLVADRDRETVLDTTTTSAPDPSHDARLHLVSSRTLHGIHELLLEVERRVLRLTGRQRMVIRVPMGGPEVAWLYKNAAVTETGADPGNSERLLVSAVITEAKLQQFRHQFIKNRAAA